MPHKQNENNEKYAYSADQEHYHTDLCTVIDEISDEDNVGQEVDVYQGEVVIQRHKDFLVTDWLIEDMQIRACDQCGEIAQDYLDGIGREKIDELESIICDWLDKNAEAPTFYMVSNVKTIKVQLD